MSGDGLATNDKLPNEFDYGTVPYDAHNYEEIRRLATSRRLAAERLGTDNLRYVRGVGFVAIEPEIPDLNQLVIEFRL